MSTRAMSDWTPKRKTGVCPGNHPFQCEARQCFDTTSGRLIVDVTRRGSFIFLGVLSPASSLMNTGSALAAIVSPLVFG